MFIVAALYKFVKLNDCQSVQSILKSLCATLEIKGTFILAPEGINGTVAGNRSAIDRLKAWFDDHEHFQNLVYKESQSEKCPFYRLKIKLKKEIVTLRRSEINPGERTGQYVNSKDWNKLIADPEVIVIDTRNAYEVSLGTFKNSFNPQTNSFIEFPDRVKQHLDPKVHKKIAMFCTGGIRCEKASAYMLSQGFENVYHLKGGILQYLEEVPHKESLWEGDCFVFDQRVTVNHHREQGNNTLCYGCRNPLTPENLLSIDYEEGVSCSYCIHNTSEKRKKDFRERQKQIHLAAAKGQKHIGASR